jgi:osmotically-inducible protein OsmY
MSITERIRQELRQRLRAHGRDDTSDLRIAVEGDTLRLEGSVDDAFIKSLAETIAREAAGGRSVESRIEVRDDLGAEAGPKETEFGSSGAVRAAMGTIPHPE